MITHVEARKRWGDIVFQNSNTVTRLREDGEDICIFINRKDENGIEVYPIGRVIGHNYLSFSSTRKEIDNDNAR